MPRRLLTIKFWRSSGGLLLGAVVACGFLLVVAVIVTVRAESAVCVKVDRLATAQLGGLRRGLKTLPGLAYYKDHPDELAATQRAIRRQIRAIRDASC